jgi:hypothetical protein
MSQSAFTSQAWSVQPCVRPVGAIHMTAAARSRLRRKRDGLLVTLALGHHGPGHARNLVGKCNGDDLLGAAATTP